MTCTMIAFRHGIILDGFSTDPTNVIGLASVLDRLFVRNRDGSDISLFLVRHDGRWLGIKGLGVCTCSAMIRTTMTTTSSVSTPAGCSSARIDWTGLVSDLSRHSDVVLCSEDDNYWATVASGFLPTLESADLGPVICSRSSSLQVTPPVSLFTFDTKKDMIRNTGGYIVCTKGKENVAKTLHYHDDRRRKLPSVHPAIASSSPTSCPHPPASTSLAIA